MSAIDAPNLFIETNGRRLAYRSIGSGQPIVLCTRFRGNLDCWDPAFLDALAGAGFRVITFDYSGLGLSTGTATYNPFAMAADPRDLIEALELRDVVIAGWSLGGIVAQVVVAVHPTHLSHAVLFGTTPPGPIVKPAEELFFTTAAREVNDFEDEVILFFEPRSPESRAAARRSVDRIAARTKDRSVPVPAEFARANLSKDHTAPIFPALPVLEALRATTLPILHIAGDHDIIFPVENWYALNQTLPTVQLLTYPSAGHGPHHQHPEASAQHIASFVRTTSRVVES
ncbi:alpha/beta fold hydrolase [Nannocystis punicea]|uniref:Alpha/beta hydrolase n=1 Tax=Nannocystis punicea TaxID=2995304 RepID=A0ABY7H0D8_9BACT|nr:alpha/beta hydrolase [Nannocystis poenicansa]WAS92714.1 alpha/beta hydrolase [Nannocystis poenicansa]